MAHCGSEVKVIAQTCPGYGVVVQFSFWKSSFNSIEVHMGFVVDNLH
jgi:hypothetical protein